MQIYLFFHNRQTFFDYFFYKKVSSVFFARTVEVRYPANYFLNTK